MYYNFRNLKWCLALLLGGLALFLSNAPARATIQQSATLAWDAEADPSVAGYRIYYGTKSGQYPQRIDVGNSTTATIPNLSVGSTYYFVVTAYDASNLESSPSAEVSFTVYSFTGQYGGSVSGTTGAHSGVVKINLLNTGAFTGTVTYGSATYRLNGMFNSTGSYQTVIEPSNGSIISVNLSLSYSSTGYTITGTIDDGQGASPITAEGIVYNAANPAPYAGRYTILIQSGTSANGAPSPAGTGIGTLVVSALGQTTFAGVLADGTPFSVNGSLAANGVWNLFIPLYGKNAGMLEGTIQFENIDGVSDLDGTVMWVKPANSRTVYYPAGFTVSAPLIGSAFAPANGVVMSTTHAGTFQATGGHLVDPMTTMAEVTAITSSSVKAGGLYSLNLSANRLTGLVTGTFLNPDTAEKVHVNVAVFQKQNLAAGNFTSDSAGNGQGGAITLE